MTSEGIEAYHAGAFGYSATSIGECNSPRHSPIGAQFANKANLAMIHEASTQPIVVRLQGHTLRG